MPVLVDSNVILDVVQDDAEWADWSDWQITAFQPQGLIINPVIYAELCVGAASQAEADEVVRELKLGLLELSREALFLSAKAFLKYRRQGGMRTSTMPDFFIGGQAQALGLALITRDRRRYETYFPGLTLICP